MTTTELAARAQIHMQARQYDQAKACLMAITDPRPAVQAIVVNMLLLLPEHAAATTRESSTHQ